MWEGFTTVWFVHRFVGKAVFDRQLIDLPLSHTVCMRILGKTPALDDLEVVCLLAPWRVVEERVGFWSGFAVCCVCPESRPRDGNWVALDVTQRHHWRVGKHVLGTERG
jgi:hypothetical protein